MWRTSNAVHCTQHETSNTCAPELHSYMKSSPHTTPQRVHRSFWQHSQSVAKRSNRTVAFLCEFELCESEIQYCDITQKLPKFHFMHKTGNTAHPKIKNRVFKKHSEKYGIKSWTHERTFFNKTLSTESYQPPTCSGAIERPN